MKISESVSENTGKSTPFATEIAANLFWSSKNPKDLGTSPKVRVWVSPENSDKFVNFRSNFDRG